MLLPIRLRPSGGGIIRPYPSLPRINWNHPLAADLQFYHYDRGDGGYDITQGRNMSFVTSTILIRVLTTWGYTYEGNGSASDGIQYASNNFLRALPPMSWGCGFSRATSGSEVGAQFFCRQANNLGSAPFINWTVEDRAGGTVNNVSVAVNSGGTLTEATGTVLGLNAYHAVTAVCPDTATLNWWADGVKQTGLSGLTIQSVTSGDNVLLYTDKGGPGGFQRNIYWGAFWSRALNANEVAQLWKDPYCFLIYPEDDIFAELVGTSAAFTWLQMDEAYPRIPEHYWKRRIIRHD